MREMVTDIAKRRHVYESSAVNENKMNNYSKFRLQLFGGSKKISNSVFKIIKCLIRDQIFVYKFTLN